MFCRCRSSPSRQQEDYLDEKVSVPLCLAINKQITNRSGNWQDNVDKQWKEYTHEQYNGAMYHGYHGMDDYRAYGSGLASKSSSLHKNYRGQNGGYPGELMPAHQSLDRRHYEQQQHAHHSRRSHQGPYEMNDRAHHPGRDPRSYSHQMQPDFYFMPHQRKYSSDVVRVFVDYENQ